MLFIILGLYWRLIFDMIQYALNKVVGVQINYHICNARKIIPTMNNEHTSNIIVCLKLPR